MKFINIKTCANNNVYINIDFIESIISCNDKTIIYLGTNKDEYYETYETINEIIEKMHKNKGFWILQKNGDAICSKCKRTQHNCYDLDNWDNYCHFCGADMRDTPV